MAVIFDGGVIGFVARRSPRRRARSERSVDAEVRDLVVDQVRVIDVEEDGEFDWRPRATPRC